MECRNDLLNLAKIYENDADIFLRQFELCRSLEGRIIDGLMITSHEGKEGIENIKTD